MGSCHADRSGFEGKWTEKPLVFDNSYFKEMLKKRYEPMTVCRQSLTRIHPHWSNAMHDTQTRALQVSSTGNPQHRHWWSGTIMLTSDLALLEERAATFISMSSKAYRHCVCTSFLAYRSLPSRCGWRSVRCSVSTPRSTMRPPLLRMIAALFLGSMCTHGVRACADAEDQALFFEDFTAAWFKMQVFLHATDAVLTPHRYMATSLPHNARVPIGARMQQPEGPLCQQSGAEQLFPIVREFPPQKCVRLLVTSISTGAFLWNRLAHPTACDRIRSDSPLAGERVCSYKVLLSCCFH